MKNLLLCIIFLILLDQVVAPLPDICQPLYAVRFKDSHPQFCTNMTGMLEWNSFCNGINMKGARVICRVLGYPGDVSIMQSTLSGEGIQGLDCSGEETLLTECSYAMALTTCTFTQVTCHQCTVFSMCGAGLCTNGTCMCSNGCENEGYCFLGDCICAEGFGGPLCRDCSPPCQNGGLCSPGGECQCMGSFYGAACEFNSTTATSGNAALTTVQTTNNVTVLTAKEISLTLVIAVVVPALICSYTLIIMCFGILVFLAFTMTRMKPELGAKVELNTYKKSDSNNSPSIRKLPADDLENSNHDYCCIQETVIPNTSATNRTTDGVYEVMTLDESSKDRVLDKQGTTANDASKERNNAHYEIDNMDDY